MKAALFILQRDPLMSCNPRKTIFARSVRTQQARGVDLMLFHCWPSVADAGPTSKQHWFNLSCFPGAHRYGMVL